MEKWSEFGGRTHTEIRRGDIYYADLSPVVGCEQGGIRPVLLIQNDVGNHYSPTVIVAAITGRKKKPMPTHIYLRKREGLQTDSVIMLEQMRTIDRARLIKYIGRLDGDSMAKVDKAIAISLGLGREQAADYDYCPAAAL